MAPTYLVQCRVDTNCEFVKKKKNTKITVTAKHNKVKNNKMKYACIPLCGYTTFCLTIRTLMNIGCSQFLAIVNKDIMKQIYKLLSFCVAMCFYLSQIPKCGRAGLYGRRTLFNIAERKYLCLSKLTEYFCIPICECFSPTKQF